MKKIGAFIVASAFAFGAAGSAFAQTASTTAELNVLITSLKSQIADLNVKLNALVSARAAVETTNADVQETLKLIAGLREGMTSDQIAEIQAILAADPSVYPRGLVTGYYGPLTKEAIAKFKEKYEKRHEKFNERMKEAFERMHKKMAKMEKKHDERMDKMEKKFEKKEDKMREKLMKRICHVPPGLLTAPGYQKTHQDEWSRLWKQWKECLDRDDDDGDHDEDEDDDDDNGTTTPDTTKPVITSLSATSTASTTATVNWMTNESATSKVYYGTATPINLGTALMVSNSTLVTSHSLGLTGLTASTTYYYVAESKDAAGNTATSSQASFMTLM